MYNIEVFGEWLDERMHDTGLTEAALAKIVGVTQQAVSRWHTGAARPGGQRIGKLAIALGASADEVIAQLERDDESSSLVAEPVADRSLADQVVEMSERIARLERLVGARKPANRRRS